MNTERISVVGLGYIGLPTAALIATQGYSVCGVDINENVVNTVNGGGVHIVEPELDSAVKSAVSSGYFKASTAVEEAEVFVIAVPTPFIEEDKSPDISYVLSAVKSIAPVLKKGDLVLLESTSPVGTTKKIRNLLAELRTDLNFAQQYEDQSDVLIAYCPERVLPGRVLHELVNNDRVVGGINQEAAKKAKEFYKLFVKGECFLTDSSTAEMVKLTENSFRDVNIAFANELSMICDEQGINVWELISLANRHPRVSILEPGPGVGGHCISVDPWFIVDSSPEKAKLIRTSREVNDSKPIYVIEQVMEKVKAFESAKVACLGMAFKPDIDDLRESPSLGIVEKLVESGVYVLAVEPNVTQLPPSLVDKKNVVLNDLNDAVAEADIVVMLVSHKEFKSFPKAKLEGKIVIDTKGVWTS